MAYRRRSCWHIAAAWRPGGLLAPRRQATTLAVITLVAAVPLGVATGRTVWRLFAEQLGVVPDVSTPVALLALVVPATILLANVISIGPAVTAMRTHPASVLREE